MYVKDGEIICFEMILQFTDYISFMILPNGMKVHYEARQCHNEVRCLNYSQ